MLYVHAPEAFFYGGKTFDSIVHHLFAGSIGSVLTAETQLYHIEKPGGPLNVCKAPHIGLGHIVKELLPRGKQPVKFPLQLPTVVLYTTKQVHQIAVDIVIDLQLARLLLLGEKYPGRATEYLNIALHLVRGETL